MAVLLETSKGDIVVDLFCDDCPLTCKNFLKLCKIKYYNNCLFTNVQHNFLVQTGDPTNTGKGGSSVYGLMYGEQARFFDNELRPHLKHRKKGMLGMASPGENLNASQFYITTGEEIKSLDDKHTIFGQVAEGFDVLDALNEAFVDGDGRPLQNIRIRHTIILDDPFPDPPELGPLIPDRSPALEYGTGDRLEDDWVPNEDQRPEAEVEAETRKAEAHHRAVVLEMVGDLPDADAKPPSNMLFICKLNPVTTEEDLEIIFSRFGSVTSCDIIRDYKTGDSLNYGFIGFDSDDSCEAAYFKMNNAVIDDRRVRVDFSQSVHHLWKQFRRGGKNGGNATMAKDAEQHVRQERSKVELKGGQRQQYSGRATGGSHGLLLEADELLYAAAAAAPPRRPHPPADAGPSRERDSGGRGAHRSDDMPPASASGRGSQRQLPRWSDPRDRQSQPDYQSAKGTEDYSTQGGGRGADRSRDKERDWDHDRYADRPRQRSRSRDREYNRDWRGGGGGSGGGRQDDARDRDRGQDRGAYGDRNFLKDRGREQKQAAEKDYRLERDREPRERDRARDRDGRRSEADGSRHKDARDRDGERRGRE